MKETVTYLDGQMGVTEKIKGAMYNVCKEYLYIGFLLSEVKAYEYYREKSYTDVYDYARQELGFKKSSVINFIAVYETFALKQNGLKTMFLQDDYAHFKYSQLCEMLSLSEKQRAKVKPDMTIRQIRQMKKSDQMSGQNVVSLFGSLNFVVSLPPALADRVSAFVSTSGTNFDSIVAKALENYLDAVSSSAQKMG